ncbi:MAG: hypothetical protein ACTSRU_17380 [Candidatus Hodarchaeales archaeon]
MLEKCDEVTGKIASKKKSTTIPLQRYQNEINDRITGTEWNSDRADLSMAFMYGYGTYTGEVKRKDERTEKEEITG